MNTLNLYLKCTRSCHTLYEFNVNSKKEITRQKHTHTHTYLTCLGSIQATGLRVQHLPKSNVCVWPWVTHSIELEKWCTRTHTHAHTQPGTQISIKLKKKRVECPLPLQGLLCDKIGSGCSPMQDSWAHQTTVNHITEAGRAQLH